MLHKNWWISVGSMGDVGRVKVGKYILKYL